MEEAFYRYVFGWNLPLEEIEATLRLALVATECLHGSAQVSLDVKYSFDSQVGICEIQASTAVGRDLNRLFAGLIQKEFGEASFWVERRRDHSPDHTEEKAECPTIN
jgi:hypothetical protein